MSLFNDHFVRELRQQFPALARQVAGKPAVFLDGPAGTQVPRRVIDAISEYLANRNANHGGLFATSIESDAMLDDAHRGAADMVGANDAACIAFGQNMSSLTFALSRAISNRWRAGDEVVVTRLDHDANVSPWVLAARDAGAVVKYVGIKKEDCTLDLDQLRAALSPRTRLVAVGCASNATGTINPVREICQAARAVGAWTFLDAVHYAPHALMDVEQFDCDFLACSAYKFFGPHVGIQWGRRQLLEELTAYKVRPATDELPGKWMTGTQNHEGIAGVLAAIDYLADLGRMVTPAAPDRRTALCEAFHAIREYETKLVDQLLKGLGNLPSIRIWGITDNARLSERLPTVAVTHRTLTAAEVAHRLAEQGIFVWHGNYYALQLTESLGLEPHGMVRIGLAHYNTAEEVDRMVSALKDLG